MQRHRCRTSQDGRAWSGVTAASGSWNSCEIGSLIRKKIVKSKAWRVQPSHAPTQACHGFLVGSFHYGTVVIADEGFARCMLSAFRCSEWRFAGRITDYAGPLSKARTPVLIVRFCSTTPIFDSRRRYPWAIPSFASAPRSTMAQQLRTHSTPRRFGCFRLHPRLWHRRRRHRHFLVVASWWAIRSG